ncbi:MAG: YidC/Oxa1 family membrane protein insertase [Acidimicrobiia bacterium]|nr:YidC/Oxa1 family membrane protein insertase [Acidimicrobiia bacterium]
MDPLYKAIGWLLAFFYELVPPHNLGISIILLTCTVMLVLFPLTAKQTRSMISMQKVQPEIKRLQQLHKNDKQKQNEEIMKFYQENKINPLSGCLPLLMQMPVFFALFHVLRDVKKKVPTSGQFATLFHDICPGAETASACKNGKGLTFLGMDLSKTAMEAKGTFTSTLPYFVLVGLVVLTGWYQSRQTMARQRQNPNAAPVNAQMQMVTKILPIMFGFFSLNFAAGLVVYFVASNGWRIGQQQLVLNKIYDAAHATPGGTTVVDAKSTERPPGGDGPEKPGTPKQQGGVDPKKTSGARQPTPHPRSKSKKKKRKR